MEFSLICPTDGQLELGLEDITAVVFRGPESIDLLFKCPRCGASLQASLHVPGMLAMAVELARQAQRTGGEDVSLTGVVGEREAREDVRARRERERVADAYCEYFRRQLAKVRYVDDLLAEIDGR